MPPQGGRQSAWLGSSVVHPILISTYELGHQPQLGAELAARLDELEVIDLELSSSNDAARAIGRATHVVLTAPMLTGALKARELIEATRDRKSVV